MTSCPRRAGRTRCNNGTNDYSGTIALPTDRGGDFFLAAGCGGASGYTCNTGGSHGAWALVQLFWAHFLLSSDAAPRGTGFSGSALQPGARGTAHLVFTASDPAGPGVYRITVKVGHRTVWSGTPNDNGGRCVPVGTDTASGALMFDWRQPCPATEVVDLPVPTARLPEGRHELTVIVTDAAGNSSTVLDQAITTAKQVTTPVLRGRRAVHAQFTIAWRWNGSHTRLVSISARRVPRGSYVRFSCVGKRCPQLGSAHAAHLKKLLRRLDGRVFTAGDTVLIRVTRPGRKAERIKLVIRRDKIPLARLLRG